MIDIKQNSDRSYDIAVAKKNALEKAQSRQLLAYNGNLFQANPATICLVQTLMSVQESFVVLDTNNNPCKIDHPQEFLTALVERNQEALNAYHVLYQELKAKRGS